MPEEDLPRHAYFGDGETIPDEYFANIRDAYEKSTIRFPWQPNDVLLLDNLRVCHGRDPFTGARKVLVSMCSPANYSQFRVDGFA
jgi:alpha-ketoglutarate-dependent taurine dioxygenase